jgi:hypothetical protein
MIEGSEWIKSSAHRTKRPALQVVEESNKVDVLQNGATPPCVLIIRRSLVRVQPPPPDFSGSGPGTWVTQCTGYIGNTFGPTGFSSGSNTRLHIEVPLLPRRFACAGRIRNGTSASREPVAGILTSYLSRGLLSAELSLLPGRYQLRVALAVDLVPAASKRGLPS